MDILSQLRQRHALLTARHAKAKAAVDAAFAARQKFLLTGDLDGDEKAATALQAKFDTAQSALSGLDMAMSAQAALITEAEVKVENERLTTARKVATDKLNADAAEIKKTIEPWLKQTRDLSTSFGTVSPGTFEAGALSRFLADAAEQFEIAAPSVLSEIASLARLILSGEIGIPAKSEAVLAVEVKIPVAEAVTPPVNYPKQRILHSGTTFEPMQRGPGYVVGIGRDQQ